MSPNTASIDVDAEGAGSEEPLRVRFGRVTLAVAQDGVGVRRRHTDLGSTVRAQMSETLARPGIQLPVRRDVPLFFSDPTNPNRVVRLLDGKREIGTFENGMFKASE